MWFKDAIRSDKIVDASVEHWELKLHNFSALNLKHSGTVRMCEWQGAGMQRILITFYKNINDKMFTSAASENGALWMNSLLFPLIWRLFENVLVAGVNPALNEIMNAWPLSPRQMRSINE